MSTFVFVHGAWHGGWCWDRLKPLLERAGHLVIAPDLPGHGKDKTPIKEVSLKAYTDSICNILDQQSEKVILVGHSLGGITITQVAEQRPDSIEILVYLTAFLLRDGESRLNTAGNVPSGSLLQLQLVPEEGYSTVRDECLKPSFYHDCSDEDVEWAKSNLVPQALQPLGAPVKISDSNFGRVRRVYIECLQDRALVPELQKRMYSETSCEKVISMDCSHSPFISAPGELAGHLTSLV